MWHVWWKEEVGAGLWLATGTELLGTPRPRRGIILKFILKEVVGRDSSVGTATCYGLDGPGIESQWWIFRSHSDRLWGQPSLLYDGYRVFPGGKATGAWR
jgi:hypothetical protein